MAIIAAFSAVAAPAAASGAEARGTDDRGGGRCRGRASPDLPRDRRQASPVRADTEIAWEDDRRPPAIHRAELGAARAVRASGADRCSSRGRSRPTLWIFIASLQTEGAVTSVPAEPLAHPELRPLRRPAEPGPLDRLDLGQHPGRARDDVLHARARVAGRVPARPTRGPGARRDILGVIIATQMVPGIVLGIPVLLIFIWLGLKDSVVGLILANVAFLLPARRSGC